VVLNATFNNISVISWRRGRQSLNTGPRFYLRLIRRTGWLWIYASRTTDGRPFKSKKLSVPFLYPELTPFRGLVSLVRRRPVALAKFSVPTYHLSLFRIPCRLNLFPHWPIRPPFSTYILIYCKHVLVLDVKHQSINQHIFQIFSNNLAVVLDFLTWQDKERKSE
jgi:hypothetical protein